MRSSPLLCVISDFKPCIFEHQLRKNGVRPGEPGAHLAVNLCLVNRIPSSSCVTFFSFLALRTRLPIKAQSSTHPSRRISISTVFSPHSLHFFLHIYYTRTPHFFELSGNSLVDVSHQILPIKFDLKHKKLCFTSVCAKKAPRVFGGDICTELEKQTGAAERIKHSDMTKKRSRTILPDPILCHAIDCCSYVLSFPSRITPILINIGYK